MSLLDRKNFVKVLSGATLVSVVFLFIFSLFQLPSLHSRYSVRDFFPENHPALETSEEVARRFQLQDTPAFLVSFKLKAHEKGTWLRRSRMAGLLETTRDVGAWKGVKQALSLASLELAVESGSDLLVGPFAETVPPAKWSSMIREQALLRPLFISRDLRSVLLVVEPSDLSPTALASLDQRLRRDLGRRHPEAWAAVTGVPAIQIKLAQRVEREVGRSLALCLFAFMAVFMLFYRGWKPLAFVAVSLVTCNITVLGLLAYLGIPFTVLLSTLPIVVSLTVVSMSVHTLPVWSERARGMNDSWNSRVRQVFGVLRSIAGPNFLGAFTTAIGFAVLAWTIIPAIRQYALTMAMMVMVSWILMHALFLLGLPLFEAQSRRYMVFPRKTFLLAMKNARLVTWGTLGLAGMMAVAGLRLNFSAHLFDDLPREEIVRQAMIRVDYRHGGSVPYDVTISGEGPDAWKHPGALNQLQRALREIRRVAGVGSAISVSDFLADRMPDTPAHAAEAYFLFSMSAENPLREYLSSDARSARVSIRLRDLSSDEVDRVRADVMGILKKRFPGAVFQETGLSVNTHAINREVAKGLVFGFWHSLLMISLALLPVLWSWRLSLLAMIPNLIPPAMLIGWMAMLQTPVKPGIALIFSIAIGLAFNNTVYLLLRLRKESKAGVRPRILSSWRKEMVPCFSESLIMAVGFSLFLASGFGLNQTFGAYMLLAIATGAWADLIFLPALLKTWPALFSRRNSRPPSTVRPDRVVSSDEGSLAAKAASWATVVFLAGLLAPLGAEAKSRAGGNEADRLLTAVRTNMEARSESARIRMVILEANGDKKVREIDLSSLRDEGTYRARAQVVTPADIRGTALLAEIRDGEQNQWLYLPSTKQVRRVVSGRKSAGVLGSELSPDDLDPSSLRGASRRVVKRTPSSVLIEVLPGAQDGPYTKAMIEVAAKPELPRRILYYKGKNVVKSVTFEGYARQPSGLYRPQKVRVKNLVNKRGTDVELSKIRINPKLRESEFKPASLGR